MIFKYPWYSNVHDIQISMISKYPRVTCDHTSHMCSHLSHVVTLVTCGHTCHPWSPKLTLITYCFKCQWCGHTYHIRSPLSHIVTAVTCCHNCHSSHMLSQLSHVVTIAPCHNCPMLSHWLVTLFLLRNWCFHNFSKSPLVDSWWWDTANI